jgi:hypothetical protein
MSADNNKKEESIISNNPPQSFGKPSAAETKPVYAEMKVIEPKEQPQAIPEVDPVKDFWSKLNATASENARKNLEYLITIDSYTFNGITYESEMVNRKNMIKLKKLLNEAVELDAENEFEKYSQNILDRGCLVIKDMTPEKFEKGDYNILENLVVAWSLKPRGFRQLQQSV